MASLILQAARTFFDFGVYADAARQRRRRTIGFLAMLVLVATVASTVSLSAGLNRLVDRVMPIVDQVPSVVIRDGKASTDVPQPWVRTLLRTDDGRDLVLIIDTTGKLNDFAPGQIGLFLAHTEIKLRGDEGDTQAVSLSLLPNLELSPKVIRQWLQRVRWMAPPVIGVVLYVLFFSIKLTQAFLLVLVGLAAAAGRRWSFGTLLSVSIYALAPAILVDAALSALPFWLPQRLPLYGILAVGYTIAAVRRLPNST